MTKYTEVDTSEAPLSIIGTVGRHPIYSGEGCMPDRAGAWVADERRVRRLQRGEMAKAKGLPGEWLDKSQQLPAKAVESATSLICDALGTWWHQVHSPTETHTVRPVSSKTHKFKDPPTNRDDETAATAEETVGSLDEDYEWEYEAPDLSEGSGWYQERVETLEAALKGLPSWCTRRDSKR
ncbi:hypothetical protein SEMRO_3038_G342600.1 [Seminavis robusta]|uniref:Uncharacterized protein n=1 Tax=Seminavis robusta TaxID=568900 RepID=A0A9N8F176_9STRA|nr:hypothetical protein SEMRO_3038_G342600.1 [Seminavis robusta]|eukprot:Sro3038_g342600.1 n/a (181) ;mRNA; f:365-907